MASEWDAYPAVQPEKDEWAAYPKADMSLGEAMGQAIQPSTLLRSGKQLVKDMAYPFMHPVQTYEGVKTLGKGIYHKFDEGVQPEEAAVDAVGNLIYDRYGTWSNAKNTLATDPLGLAGDASMLLTGGGSAAVRAPGIIGKVGKTANMVGHAIDPIGATLQTAGKVAAPIVGMTTGAGTHAIRTAAKAGREGGEQAASFLDNMRGGPNVASDAVTEASQGVNALRSEMQTGYLANKKNWAKANAPINWSAVDKAIDKVGEMRTFRGVSGTGPAQNLDDAAGAARLKVARVVDDWKKLDPAEYHTVLGIDALKQKIGKMLDNTPYDQRSTRAIYGEVYKELKNEIIKQSPTYGAAMKQYEDAMEVIREMESTLRLTPGASIDTKMRRLQSIMRNNANTNYGRRLQLGQMLEQAGAKTLFSKLAGQSLNDWLPRGLQRGVGAANVALNYSLGGLSSFLDPSVIGTLAIQSPRAMGEASYYLGKTHRPIGYGAWQAGRLQGE